MKFKIMLLILSLIFLIFWVQWVKIGIEEQIREEENCTQDECSIDKHYGR